MNLPPCFLLLLPGSVGMQSLTVKAPRSGDFPGEVNVTVQPSEPQVLKFGIYIRANYHYPLQHSDKVAPAELAKNFISTQWRDATGTPRRVARQIFTKIQPDD